MLLSMARCSGFNRASSVPGYSCAKASSAGANTVKGPGPFRVSTSPAALTAATSVVKFPAATAVSTMSSPVIFGCPLRPVHGLPGQQLIQAGQADQAVHHGAEGAGFPEPHPEQGGHQIQM